VKHNRTVQETTSKTSLDLHQNKNRKILPKRKPYLMQPNTCI